jgi:hypothetical protein
MIELVITLALLGFVMWVITLIEMPGKMLMLIQALAVLIAVLYVLHYFGLISSLHNLKRLG